MFFLAILGVDPVQNLAYGYLCSYNKPIEVLRLCNSCIVYEHKTKDVQGQGPTNLPVFLSASLMFSGFLNHFPLW